MLQQTKFPLKWTINKTKSSKIIFKGYEQDTAVSEATGLKKMFYDRSRPYTREIKYFNAFKPENEIEKPKAYIIPAGWYEAVERLKLNGVIIKDILKDTFMNVQAYHIDEYKSRPAAYEKHHGNYGVRVSKTQEMIKFLKGDHIIELNQPANRYIIEMLEPTGDDSFFAWNFFDGILQQKEGYSDYRWEEIAAEVLRTDPALRAKLETKKIAEPDFAKNNNAILNYIYKNSVYYEKAHMRYPVYRIE